MNYVVILFMVFGYIDLWGNSGGMFKGNLLFMLNESLYGMLEINNIIINNSDVLFFQLGECGMFFFSFVVMQVLVKMFVIILMLVLLLFEDVEFEILFDQEMLVIFVVDE